MSPLTQRFSRLLFLAMALAPVLALAQNGTARNNKKAAANAGTAATTTTNTTSTTTTNLAKAPAAKNMKELAKTPQGQARAKKFSKNFGGADGTANKDIKY